MTFAFSRIIKQKWLIIFTLKHLKNAEANVVPCRSTTRKDKAKQNGNSCLVLFCVFVYSCRKECSTPGAVMHQSTHNNQNSWKPFRGKGDSLCSFSRWKESRLLSIKYQFLLSTAVNKSNRGNNINLCTSVLIFISRCCSGSQISGWNCSPQCLQCTVQRALDESRSMVSKIHSKADIPVSWRSLGGKKKDI